MLFPWHERQLLLSPLSYCACPFRLSSKCHILHKTSQISFFASWHEHKKIIHCPLYESTALCPWWSSVTPRISLYKDFNKDFSDLLKWRELRFAIAYSPVYLLWVALNLNQDELQIGQVRSTEKNKKTIISWSMNITLEYESAILCLLTIFTLKITLCVQYQYTHFPEQKIETQESHLLSLTQWWIWVADQMS